MLRFQKITLSSLQEIYPFLLQAQSRSCDFTIGGIYMWIELFDYRYSIFKDTLFIMGRLEDDRRIVAFSVPVGQLPIAESVALIVEYCHANGLCPNLSAVTDDALRSLRVLYPECSVTELTDWGDYLYSSKSLATLVGHRYNKKRNRVNKFMREYPTYEYHPLRCEDVSAVRDFFTQKYGSQASYSEMAQYENGKVLDVLDHFAELCRLGFSGGYITIADSIVAFTIGEVLNDTLYVHIEKALYSYVGSYEVINQLYAQHCCAQHPEVLYINREDDAGDAGLREAKQSYYPLAIVKKYDVFV